MTLSKWVVNAADRALVRLLCRVSGVDQLERIPQQGPLILVTNHINFLEIPVLWRYLGSRRVIGLAKAESWQNPALRWLFTQWEAIPVRRGESDIPALRASLSALKSGRILGLAPEGTRSRDGRLGPGQPGAVTIAIRSGAPLQPIAFWGGEKLKHHVRRLRRTPFHFAVGEPFHIAPRTERLSSDGRRQIADEIMIQIARLLPPAYRGVYADRWDDDCPHLRIGENAYNPGGASPTVRFDTHGGPASD